MDLENQDAIKRTVMENGKEGVIVVLGSPDPDGAQIFAETVTFGDPSYAGPLAGVPLGLPVYHILEPEIREAIDPEVYKRQVGVMGMALDAEQIIESVRNVRERALQEGVFQDAHG